MKNSDIQSAAAPDDRTEALRRAIDSVPSGAWAVGVSGGADSVALLHLLRARGDLRLHVTHLNHQTRGEASDGDEAFVAALARSLGVSSTCRRRSEIESGQPLRNPSARYRAARLALFRHVVSAEKLAGVILAHHADDQAETVLHRLLRGGGAIGLAGMRAQARVGGMLILRPLLPIPGQMLRDELAARRIAWREDASNASPRYLRNRLRNILQSQPALRDAALELGEACGKWRTWLDLTAPRLPQRFAVRALGDLPPSLARHAARRWLRERGCTGDELAVATERVVLMALDAASPSRQQVPGGLFVRRRSGVIFMELDPS